MLEALLDDVRKIRGGRWVDPRERLALNRLLVAYEGATHSELRTAVVATLACNVAEARAVALAFDAHLAPSAEVVEPAPRPIKTSRRAWLALLVPLLSFLLAWSVSSFAPPSPPSDKPPDAGAQPVLPNQVTSPVVRVTGQRVYRLPSLDEARAWTWFTPPLELVGVVLLGGVLALAAVGLRVARRRRLTWHDQRWQKLADTRGPRVYDVSSSSRPSVMLQQVARSLEIAAGNTQQATYLDVPKTVEQTARVAFPTLIYAQKTAVGRVLVLRDVSPGMARWRGKVDRLLDAMRSQAALDLLYFDRHPTLVSRLPGQKPEPLRNWANQHGGLPLVVLSGATFFEHSPMPNHALKEALEPWPVRVLLHPLDDGSAWPSELTRDDAALPGFSMSRRGYRSLRRWLPGRAALAKERLPVPHRPLDPRDVMRLRGMVSFMPRPSFDVAELLRAQLLPSAPEAILLSVDPILGRGPEARRDVAEARAWLRDWFAQHPQQAEEFFRFWDEHVLDPVQGAAHERYLRDRAIMALYLADPAEAALRAKELVGSALADEWLVEVEQLGRDTSPEPLKRLASELDPSALATARELTRRRPRRWQRPSVVLTLLLGLAFAALIPLGELFSPPVVAAAPEPVSCRAGSERCGDQCADLATDAAHCGKCDSPCRSGQACVAGACQCTDSKRDCAGACVDLQTDPSNCGRCGRVCESGCSNGECTTARAAAPKTDGCLATQTLCDGRCVDLKTDSTNCGGCGVNCGVANARRTCRDGACQQPACNQGWGNCDGRVRNGCETPTTTLTNCAICGNACGSWPHRATACSYGMCVPGACESGWLDCDGDWANGCEVNGSSSTRHCGGCGTICPAGTLCGNGTCQALAPAEKKGTTPTPSKIPATTTERPVAMASANPSCDDCNARQAKCLQTCKVRQDDPEAAMTCPNQCRRTWDVCIAGCTVGRAAD